MTSLEYDVVVPTVGRPSLAALLEALAAADGPRPCRVFLVDDRRDRSRPLLTSPIPESLRPLVTILAGGGRGPAAARNVGWRAARAPWIAFLDDDVVPAPDWCGRLAQDLVALPAEVAASQGRIRVPVPVDRRPTDWERNVQRLERARWATADMAFRRTVLEAVGGFQERFPRAYREDADLALRVVAAGRRIEHGRRQVTHPVQPASRWISVRTQAGNADDVLMRALHGRHWRRRAGIPPGRRPIHLAITAAGAAGVLALVGRRRRMAAVAATLWVTGTIELAWARIRPGPRTVDEIVTMLATSAVVPAAATFHWLRGWLTLPRRLRHAPTPEVTGDPSVAMASRRDGDRDRPAGGRRPRAVLLDRDGTIVIDVPYNGDPERVLPVTGAREALDRLRAAGVPLAIVSNQGGVARGILTLADVEVVNDRTERLLGPFAGWFVCPHGDADLCRCRKPAPGLVFQAAAALGVRPEDCVVIGDTGADVHAARAAGARPILVPTSVTRLDEIEAAPEVAPNLTAAVDLVLGVVADPARVGSVQEAGRA